MLRTCQRKKIINVRYVDKRSLVRGKTRLKTRLDEPHHHGLCDVCIVYLSVVLIDICCGLLIKLDVNIQALVDRRRVDGHQHGSVGLAQIVRVKHEAVRTVVGRVHEIQFCTVHTQTDVIV